MSSARQRLFGKDEDPRVILENIKAGFAGTLSDFVNSRTDKTQFVIACLEHQARLDSLMNLLCEQHDGISFEEAAEMVEREREEMALRQGEPVPALDSFEGNTAGD